jgi:hypothetical protein
MRSIAFTSEVTIGTSINEVKAGKYRYTAIPAAIDAKNNNQSPILDFFSMVRKFWQK